MDDVWCCLKEREGTGLETVSAPALCGCCDMTGPTSVMAFQAQQEILLKRGENCQPSYNNTTSCVTIYPTPKDASIPGGHLHSHLAPPSLTLTEVVPSIFGLTALTPVSLWGV